MMDSKCTPVDVDSFVSVHRRIVAEYEKTIAQMIGEFSFGSRRSPDRRGLLFAAS